MSNVFDFRILLTSSGRKEEGRIVELGVVSVTRLSYNSESGILAHSVSGAGLPCKVISRIVKIFQVKIQHDSSVQ